MRTLVTGAYGFIGGQIVTALGKAGHRVLCAVRNPGTTNRFAHLDTIECDMSTDINPDIWISRLEDIDAVVNCAGILHESTTQTFEAVHNKTPCALFDACKQTGIKKVIQISAIGNSDDVEFIRSKHKADKYLSSLDLDWVIIRPSIVYSTSGSYGGTSLLRALSAIPFILFLPGSDSQTIQPISGDDLAMTVVQAIDNSSCDRQIIEAVGAEKMTFEDYLRQFRRWLDFSDPLYVFKVPLFLIKPVVLLGEWFGKGPLGKTMYQMLQRGNAGSEGAADRFNGIVGFRTKSVAETLSESPSFVQDRWHARLYLLRPALRLFIAFLWIASGIVGFLVPLNESQSILTHAGISAIMAAPLIYVSSSLDLILGGLVLFRRFMSFAGTLMVFSLIVYTIFLGIWLPDLWLEPFGALIKNIPLIPAVLIMMVIDDIR